MQGQRATIEEGGRVQFKTVRPENSRILKQIYQSKRGH